MLPSQTRLTRLGRSLSLLLVALIIGGITASHPSFSLAAPLSLAAATDIYADTLTGQTAFTAQTIPPTSPPTASSMSAPTGVAVGMNGVGDVISLVADRDNNRVLLYNLTTPAVPLTDLAAQAQNDNLPAAAVAVYGQTSFVLATPNSSQGTLRQPTAVAIQPTTSSTNPKVYIADTGNNRVLLFNTLPASGPAGNADLVLGQTNFISNGAAGGLGQMSSPQGVAVDKSNQVYVADTGNNRILVFTNPTTSGVPASFTIGGTVGAAATQLSAPTGVAVDADGNLYVADTGNNRVLKYNAPLSNGMPATKIYGQAGPGSSTPGTSATTMRGPTSIAVDSLGNIYVADTGNHRALVFQQSASNSDTTADAVFGQQGSFTSAIANNGAVSAVGIPGFDTLYSPFGVAVNQNVPYTPVAGTNRDYRDLFVADTNNHRVLQYWTPLPNPTPSITKPAFAEKVGTATIGASANVTLIINGLDFSTGATVDWNGTIIPSTSVTRLSSKILQVTVPGTLFDATVLANTVPRSDLPIKVNNPTALRFPTPILSSIAEPYPVCFAKPTITSTTPTTAEAGAAGLFLAITGTGFGTNASFPPSVFWNDQPLTGVVVNNATSLSVLVPVDKLALPGTIKIKVSNFLPTPAGDCTVFSTSLASDFILTSPAPTITGFVPSAAVQGQSTPLDIVVKGTGFIAGGSNKTQVYFDGVLYPSAVISDSTQILLPGIPSSKFATIRDIPVRVVNQPNTPPTNGGEDTKNFPVVDPINAVINTLIPDKAVAGSPAFLLTIRGKNFSAGAKVFWNGSERTVVTRSSTELVAAILPQDVATVGTANVTVDDPTDALPASAPAVFTITGSASPSTITFLQPANVKLSVGVVALSAIASSGQPVTFTSTTPTVCTVSGSQATLLKIGTCTITASSTGASSASNSFQVLGNFSVYLPSIND